VIGVPTSAEMVVAISSARAARPSFKRSSQRARSATGVAAQLSNARAAAWTARSTSSSLPLGTRPMTSSVDASMTSMPPRPRRSDPLAADVELLASAHVTPPSRRR